jgi:hypothetical protein
MHAGFGELQEASSRSVTSSSVPCRVRFHHAGVFYPNQQ